MTHLIMAGSGVDDQHEDVWLPNSGCINHITGIKSFFRTLDESKQQVVYLGDNQVMKVEGVGTISFKTKRG